MVSWDNGGKVGLLTDLPILGCNDASGFYSRDLPRMEIERWGPLLDIRGLKYFISAAECLNFTRAAKECFITQTAMSQHIANMEKELGFQLFIRNNRNVELTVAGKDFYEQVKNIVHSYDHAVRHSQNLSTGSEGSISVIISSSIDGLAFMPRFRYFKAHHPTISLTVRISAPRYMVDQLKRGEADIAICWPEEMQQNDDIFVQNLAEFKGCLVCRSDHPLASCRSITPEKLQDAQFSIVDLAGMPNTYRAHCRDWKRLGLPIPSEAPVFDKVNRVEEILFSVIMNNYLAILPEYVKNNSTGDLAFLPLELSSPLMFTVSSGSMINNPNPALPIVLDVLRDGRIPMNY